MGSEGGYRDDRGGRTVIDAASFPARDLALDGHDGTHRIDLVDLEVQGPMFCHRVLCEGRCVYEGDRDRRIDFESDAMVRAFDFRPTWELATRDKDLALRRWLRKR